MDFSALLTLPVISVLVLAALLGTWLGFTVGKNGESRRKEQALAELEARHAEQVKEQKESTRAELEELKAMHSNHTDQINQAHQTLVDSLKSGHAAEIQRLGDEHTALVKQLNEANNDNINGIKQTHQQQLDDQERKYQASAEALADKYAKDLRAVKEEMDRTVQMFREQHSESMERLNTEHRETIKSLKTEHQDGLESLRAAHAAALHGVEEDYKEKFRELTETAERERIGLSDRIAELEGENATLGDSIRELNEGIKEARMNNMFSLSKSGERLIRVVRSVQELANELDETSRTVTGGEYSFFDQIKDQRDKETVLSLTGGERHVAVHEPEEVESPEGEETAGGEEAAVEAGDQETAGEGAKQAG